MKDYGNLWFVKPSLANWFWTSLALFATTLVAGMYIGFTIGSDTDATGIACVVINQAILAMYAMTAMFLGSTLRHVGWVAVGYSLWTAVAFVMLGESIGVAVFAIIPTWITMMVGGGVGAGLRRAIAPRPTAS
jgi:hypothetical protein